MAENPDLWSEVAIIQVLLGIYYKVKFSKLSL